MTHGSLLLYFPVDCIILTLNHTRQSCLKSIVVGGSIMKYVVIARWTN